MVKVLQHAEACRNISTTTKAEETTGETNAYKSRISWWKRKTFRTIYKVHRPVCLSAIHFASPLEQMKKLRKIIERDVEESNIKLIPGGIRDIEFTVQALQLLNGGKDESIKTGNTLSALEKLSQVKLLTKNETKSLQDAYIFYRRMSTSFNL